MGPLVQRQLSGDLVDLVRTGSWGHPILILSREKKKNFTFRENSKLQNRPDFENIPPFESFEDSVVLVSTNLSRMTNFESQRYQYPVCHTWVATQHPLCRFQSPARGPGLSPTRSLRPLRWCSGSLVEQ